MTQEIDREARFELVVGEVYGSLQRYLGRRARADDVSELLNDVLLVMWRRLEEVPSGDVLPWSYGVAKRCLANHRRGDRRRFRLVRRLTSQPSCREHTVEPAITDGRYLALVNALAELEESERELVRLWAWEQLEPREIAIVLDTTVNAVSLRLARAKKKLAASTSDRMSHCRTCWVGHRKEPRS